MLFVCLFVAAVVSVSGRGEGPGVQLQLVVGGGDRRSSGQFRVRTAVRLALPRIAGRHGPEDEHPRQGRRLRPDPPAYGRRRREVQEKLVHLLHHFHNHFLFSFALLLFLLFITFYLLVFVVEPAQNCVEKLLIKVIIMLSLVQISLIRLGKAIELLDSDLSLKSFQNSQFPNNSAILDEWNRQTWHLAFCWLSRCFFLFFTFFFILLSSKDVKLIRKTEGENSLRRRSISFMFRRPIPPRALRGC